MSKVIYVPVHGGPEVKEMREDGDDLRDMVGGSFEGLRGLEGGIAYCNAYGKLSGMPLNRFGTMLMAGILMENDFIAGPLVLCGPVVQGMESDVPENLVTMVNECWGEFENWRKEDDLGE